MLYINVSFDYELFMGENYLPEKQVLIDPVRKIVTMLNEVGVSGTFFADVCCPIRYREMGYLEFPKLFDEQLAWMKKNRQDVQLHIHTNWVEATQVGELVEFDREDFRLHNWEQGKKYNIEQIVNRGVEYLNGILLPVDDDYKCVAFRAGGFCIQPEKKIVPILYNAGIKIDSSVCRGFWHEGDGMSYDYRKYPQINNMYLNETVGFEEGVKEPIDGGVFEVPISGYSHFPYRIVASKLNKRITEQKPRGCGMKLDDASPSKPSLLKKTKAIMTATNMLTFDSYHKDSIVYMVNHLVKDERCDKNDVYISTIAHPKCMSDEHIENMRVGLLELKKNKFIKFVNMQEIARRIGAI